MKALLLAMLLIPISILADNFFILDAPRVVDGDTFCASITIPEFDITFNNQYVRLANTDTPEKNSINRREVWAAYLIKAHVANLVKSAKQVTITNLKKDKYKRILAVINIDNTDLSSYLITKKYAHQYRGAAKVLFSEEELMFIIKDLQFILSKADRQAIFETLTEEQQKAFTPAELTSMLE